MINRVVLTGRITDDLELRYTQSGAAVGTFNLAVSRQYKNTNGERETDFIRCQIWRKGAEILAQYTHKGSKIGVDGRIQTRKYDNQQGNTVYVTEVIVDNFSLLDSKNDNNQGKQNDSSTAETDLFTQNSDPVNIKDDDLPF